MKKFYNLGARIGSITFSHVPVYRSSYYSAPSVGSGMLKFHVKDFLCDGQTADRQAFL